MTEIVSVRGLVTTVSAGLPKPGDTAVSLCNAVTYV
jgi:hypothetical protein